MRRIRYQVACSLDGFIAGPKDESDWIVADPDIRFDELFAQYDTLLMGRRTWEGMKGMGGGGMGGGHRVVVASRTLSPGSQPGVTVVGDDLVPFLEALRQEPGKDIWVFGGGRLARSLLDLGLLDTVEPAVVPVVLGGGIPMLPTATTRSRLKLQGHRVYPRSGIVLLEYSVERKRA